MIARFRIAKQKQWQSAMESLWENVLRCYLNRKYVIQDVWHICDVLHMARDSENAMVYVKEKASQVAISVEWQMFLKTVTRL